MAINLDINTSSLSTQRALNKAVASGQRSIERLSSGLRINRASDDAAGLAVADSLRADARIFSQGLKNLNDGISALNIADGSLNELTSIVTRLAELSEQAANGAYSSSQRKALDTEAQSLSSEYTRIIKTTTFNQQAILGSAAADFRVQAGYGSGAILQVRFGGAIGTGSFTQSGTYASAADAVSRAIALTDVNGDGNIDMITGGGTDTLDGVVAVRLGNGDGTFGASTSYAQQSAQTLTIAMADVNNDGVIDFVSAGRTDAADGVTSVYLGNTVDGTSPLLPFSLKTQADSRQALSLFRNKLNQLTGQRSWVGASQSRVEVALSALTATRDVSLSAESRIRDADVATETADYT